MREAASRPLMMPPALMTKSGANRILRSAGVTLLRARSVSRSDDWTLRSRIEVEIEKLEKQRRLMNRVRYWFLLPMLIANGVSLVGGHHALTGSVGLDGRGLAIFGCCGLVYGFTYWLVRRETRRKWDPVLARLRGLRDDLLG